MTPQELYYGKNVKRGLCLVTMAFAFLCCAVSAALALSLQSISVIDSSMVASTAAGDSMAPIVSADGRYVVFGSTANNLLLLTNSQPVAPTFPVRFNVYLWDRTNDTHSLVSVNRFGTGGGNGDSIPSAISTDGRYVLFESGASDLVANDSNAGTDVFLRDTLLGTNILVSVAGVFPGNQASRSATMTPDGRYIAFVSAASNLVPDDTNGLADVFVRDLQSGTTILVSSNATSPAQHSSEAPEISADGRFIAFYSTATNLVPGVTNRGEIYLRDVVAGETVLASVGALQAVENVTGSTNAVSFSHMLSADGNHLAYAASAKTNFASSLILHYNRTNGVTTVVHTNAPIANAPREHLRALDMTPDARFICFIGNVPTSWGDIPSVLLWDAVTEAVTLVSVNASGQSPNPGGGGSILNDVSLGVASWPSIDPSGRYACFVSTATDLVAGVTAGHHAYLRDLQTSNTTLVDIAGTTGIGVTRNALPRMSEDGRFVVFQSADSPLINGDVNGRDDLFLRDLVEATTQLISARHSALPDLGPNKHSTISAWSLSGDGRYVAFATEADNVVAGDTNTNRDVFVRDLLLQTNILVSSGMNGLPGHGMSFDPALSSDGRYVAFTSTATNLTAMDSSIVRDVFVRDLQNGATALGSVRSDGTAGGSGGSHSPIIGAGGRFLVFRSVATNLTADTIVTGSENLFLRDLANSSTVALTTGGALDASMTPDGRFVAFLGRISGSSVSNLYVWETAASQRVYTNSTTSGGVAISPDGALVTYISAGQLNAFDRLTKTNYSIGAMPSAYRAGLRFSATGGFLTFCSTSTQGFTDSNSARDVYLYNFATRTTTLVSRAYNGSQAASALSDSPDISFDGRFVTFRSAATNIVAVDTNGWPDVFIYDRMTGTNSLVTSRPGISRGAVFSGNGHMLIVPSWASDLAPNDFNASGDLFAFAFPYAAISQGQGGVLISWPFTSGGNYSVQFKNSIDDVVWEDLEGEATITGNRATIHDASPNAIHRFYRVLAF